eukprot:3833375-Rhodomonas_salina.2
MRVWDSLIIVFSMVLIGLHVEFCNGEKHGGNWSYAVIRRLHLVVHFARCLNVLAKCTALKDDWRKGLQVSSPTELCTLAIRTRCLRSGPDCNLESPHRFCAVWYMECGCMSWILSSMSLRHDAARTERG